MQTHPGFGCSGLSPSTFLLRPYSGLTTNREAVGFAPHSSLFACENVIDGGVCITGAPKATARERGPESRGSGSGDSKRIKITTGIRRRLGRIWGDFLGEEVFNTGVNFPDHMADWKKA